MNKVWMRLALVAGVTAVFAIAEIDQFFALLIGFIGSEHTAAIAAFIIIAFFAWQIVQKRELLARYQSPTWVTATLGVASLVLLIGPNTSGLFGWRLGHSLKFLNLPVVQTLATIGLLAMLLKVSTELRPQFESEQRETDLTWHLIFGLTAFIGVTFMFIPSTWLPPVDWAALMQGRFSDSTSSWPTWVQWALAFAAAYGFVTTQRLDERIGVDRPGVGMLRVSVIIIVVGTIGTTVVLSVMQRSQHAMYVGIVAMLVMLPLGLIGKFLVTFGGLKLLFSLQSTEPATVSTQHDDSAAPVVPAPPTAKPVIAARDYFVRAESETAPNTPPAQAPVVAAAEPSQEAQLRAALATNPIDPRRHDRLHRILASDPARAEEMIEHAKEYMAVLLSQSLREQALGLYRACSARDPKFQPNGDQVLPLVRLLMLEKDLKSALRVVNRFDATFPQHRDTAQIFFLTARMLKDVQQPERAARMLKIVISRFPEDRVVHDARILLASLGAT